MHYFDEFINRQLSHVLIANIHIFNYQNINLGLFGENSCKMYEEYGHYRADT